MLCRKCQKQIPPESLYCLHCGTSQAKPQRKPKTRGNGMGTVYKLPNGRWRAEITLGYKSQMTVTGEGEEKVNNRRACKTKSGFKTKKEALDYISTLKGDQKPIKDIKFFALYEEWSSAHYKNIGKDKVTAYGVAYKSCEPLYYRNIADLRLKDFQSVVDNRKGGYWSKSDVKILLNLMFKYALQNDYISKSYVEFVKLPPHIKSKKEVFSDEEIAALEKHYENGNEFAGYILIMIRTGVRYGEISTIKTSNIFLDEKYMIGGIKTEAGIDRVIPIGDKIKPVVERFYKTAGKLLLDMPENKFYKTYYETLEQVGVRRLRPHRCRDTFATKMAGAGIQPALIKELAGHENYNTTLQYTHPPLDTLLEAVNNAWAEKSSDEEKQ